MPVLAQIQIRYWRTVAPVVRDEMERWQARAQAIEDPELRALARAKLRDEGTHARAAAMLATLAPRPHRADATRGIVALELLFDYLDGLTERPADDPLGEGERLFGAFLEAVTIERCDEAKLGSRADAGRTGPDGRRAEAKLGSRPDAGRTGRDGRAQETLAHIRPHTDRLADSGYLDDLSRTVATALMRLPAARTITATAKQTAARAAQAQTRMHAAAQLGIGQVEEWARSEAGQIAGTIGSEPASAELRWRELLTGSASSVLALHALIAAAADPGTTPAQARAIADAYLPACMLPTLLDGLIDHEQDGRSATDGRRAMGEMGGTDGSNGARPRYLDFYPDLDELSQTLTDAARRAADRMGRLPQGLHHLAILAGLIAYYSSLPGADSPRARPLIQALQGQLTPLTIPALALTRVWRRTTSTTLT